MVIDEARRDAATTRDQGADCRETDDRGTDRRETDDRGMAPIGVALLVAVAVVLAAGIAGATMQVATGTTTGAAPTASLSLSAAGDRLTLTHQAGDRLDAGTIALRVSVDGTPLDRQPPVPFFSARGFRPGPTGPFNAASDGAWTAGQSASLRVAGTNAPELRAGRTVTVRVIVDGRAMTTLETTVESQGTD